MDSTDLGIQPSSGYVHIEVLHTSKEIVGV